MRYENKYHRLKSSSLSEFKINEKFIKKIMINYYNNKLSIKNNKII